MYEVFLLLLVSIIWGFTNPLMKHSIDSSSSKNADLFLENNSKNSMRYSRLWRFILEIKYLLLNWKYILAYLINQLGSLLFYYALGLTELSIASPLTNSLTFIFTFLFGHFIFGEKSQLNTMGWCGLGLMISGVILCFFDKLSSSS